MDNALIGSLVGAAPKCLTRVADGSSSCAYLICGAAAPE
jgi:hypothetical protein